MKKIFYILTIFIIFCPYKNIYGQLKYELKCNPALLKSRLDSLITQVGIKEATGKNDGPVQKYQDIFHISRQPYCQALQYWAFWVNAINSGEIPIPKSAMAISSFNYAKRKGTHVNYFPAVGDLLIYKNAGSSTGHVECVIEVGEKGWVLVIGGNTSNGKTGSQREGNGIYYRWRNIYHPLSRILLIQGLVGFVSLDDFVEFYQNNNHQGCNFK